MLLEDQTAVEVEGTNDARVAHLKTERRAKQREANRRFNAAHPTAAAEATKLWRQRHPARAKASKLRTRLKSLYGLTPEQRAEMLVAQCGVCGVCGTSDLSRGRWCVEHDHDTGKVRSIAHLNCNSGLGMFDDDPALLRAAAAYLEKHK